MKKHLSTTLYILLITSTLSFGQFTNVMIDNSFAPEEPSISINPLGADQIIAGSNTDNYYYSNDGGATWISNILTSSFGEVGDPCLTADSLGNFFYFHLANPLDKVVCQKSIDGGITYNNGSFATNNNNMLQDKEWATVDMHNNYIYASWSQYDNGFNPGPQDSCRIYFTKSTDNGVTFTNGLRINEFAGDCLYLDVTDPHPFVGANGEVFVSFMDSVGVRINKSTDFGDTWLPSQPVVDSGGAYRYYNVPGVTRIRAQPYSASDLSGGPYHGNLYISWSDPRNGVNNTDVFFIKSADGGNTWSQATKVNSDNTNRHQYRNAMCVDQTNGYIYIVYYDRRNYSDDSTDVYLSKSIDGGTSWIEYKISNTGYFADANVFDGDYIDIDAHAGIVRPIWTRMDNSITSIWTCLYYEPTVGIHTIQEPTARHFMVNPNPADIVAAISFTDLVVNLDCNISDASGRIVKTFSMHNEREKVIDLTDLASGIYFVKAGIETRKLIVKK